MIDVLPAIIPSSFADLEAKVARVRRSVARVQVDIVDGIFAPNKTWPYIGDDGAFDALWSEKRGLPFWETVSYEIDCMVKEPECVIDHWISAGVETIIIHVESTHALDDIASRVGERGVSLALALKPATPLSVLEPWVSSIAFVQLMGSDSIGAHGVSLDPLIFERLVTLRARYPSLPIGVDIGVNQETAPKLASAGATRLVSGSYIFGAENPDDAISFLRHADSY